VVNLEIPDFPRLLECGVRAADCIRMGYIGVDLVVDRDRGPVLLELNARPGLSIQLANRAGLLVRTQWVDRFEPERRGASERIDAARAIASECRSAA
jgi:glutathione synthase/RimK-type ligase-like ATP-grasp enzyme